MKTWLITGCSSGIGAGIANAVLKKGDNAIITARDISKLESLVKAFPETVLAVKLDITKKKDIVDAVKKGNDRFGNIDVLINNAGYGYRAAVEEGMPEQVELLFNTNFFGPIELIKEVLPQMRENRSGFIINISSIAAARSAMGSGYYAASKAALELVTNGLSKEVENLGIKVMIVEPGAFRTHFYDTSLKGADVKIDDYNETAGKNRKENVINHYNQPGDPEKAGEVIVEVVNSGSHPKCLLLGSDAVKVVTGELENKLKEIGEWSEISQKSNFD